MGLGQLLGRSRGACCTVAAAVGLLTASQALAVGNVVISEVFGGGGTNASTPNADYVELYNRTTGPVTIGGWSVQVASATSATWARVDIPAGTSLPANTYFLVRINTPSATGTALSANVNGTASATSLSAASGKVALVSNQTTLTGGCPSGAQIVDFVGYGTTADCREGGATTASNAPGHSTATANVTATTRTGGGCTDTDSNVLNFLAQSISPTNMAGGATAACGAEGSCCNVDTGACVLNTAAFCSGTFTAGGACSPNPCAPTGACCNGTTFTTCTILTSAGCANLGGFYQSDGSVCSPNPCAATACCQADGICCSINRNFCSQNGGTPGALGETCTTAGLSCFPLPANDTCGNAVALSTGTPRIGNNFKATGGDGLQNLCFTAANAKGVWFTFTPQVTSTFDISGCGTSFDADIQVFQITNCANTATWTHIACDDDRCAGGAVDGTLCTTTGNSLAPVVSGILLNGGTTYHIRLSAQGTGAGGNYQIVVNDAGATATGACCMATTGQCEIRTAVSCGSTGSSPSGAYQGDGSVCSPSPCPATVGACCATGGVCVQRLQASCTGTSTFQGVGSPCAPNPCITGACCSNTTGVCSITLATGCTSGQYQGDFSSCTPTDPCPKGACCSNSTGACTITAPNVLPYTGCASGTFQTVGSTCTPTNPCAPANDDCAGAIALSLGVSTDGTNLGATPSPIATLCSTLPDDVFYTFTPATTGYYEVTALLGSGTTSLNLMVGTACNPFDDNVSCVTSSSSADRTTGLLTLTANTTYYIRLATSSDTVRGFTLTVSSVNGGACCTSTGVCSINTQAACESVSTSTYNGNGSLCEANSCPLGACCNNTTAACTIFMQNGCSATTSTFHAGATCDPAPCPPSGACCNLCTFACSTTDQDSCIDTGSGIVWSQGATCTPSTVCREFAPPPANDAACGATVVSTGSTIGNINGATLGDDGAPLLDVLNPVIDCDTTSTTTSPGPGVWYRFQPASSGYYRVSTCGATFDTTLAIFTGSCSGGGDGMTLVSCRDDDCPSGATVACGTGSATTLASFISFVYLDSATPYYIRVRAFQATTSGGTFSLNIDPIAAGACCATAGTCAVDLAANCTATTEVYQGDNTVCGTTPCPPSGVCCNTCTYACSVTFQSNCSAATSTFSEGGTCTAPSPCITGPAPSNDSVCGTVPAVSSGVAVTGTLFTATSTGDGPDPSCETGASRGVWYTFTPATTGTYEISTCGSTFDTELTVFTFAPGDCANTAAWTEFDCDTDTCVGGASGEPVVCGSGTSSTTAAIIVSATPLTAGTTYYIRIQAEGTANTAGTGTYKLQVTPVVVGACCAPNGTCSNTTNSQCLAGGYWTSAVCETSACASAGACCNDTTYQCVYTLQANCGAGSTFFGPSSTCNPNSCIVNDDCAAAVLIPLNQIRFGTTVGSGGVTASCSTANQDVWFYFVAPSAGTYHFNSYQRTGTQRTTIALFTACGGSEIDCHNPTNDAPSTDVGRLQLTMTAGQSVHIRVGSYANGVGDFSVAVDTTEIGACCRGTSCSQSQHSRCWDGTFTVGGACSPDPCASVVCCRGSTCAFIAATDCTVVAGSQAGASTYAGAGCNASNNNTNPCCKADYNKMNNVELLDIFAFLGDWFANRPYADFNGANGVDLLDIFAFLGAWFAGACPANP